MTTKHLSGHYADGYTLSAGYSKLVIDKTAYVGGYGITVPFSATVVNQGSVSGVNEGVYLEAGGSLINGSAKNTSATVVGFRYGVRAIGAATIANFGGVYGGNDGVQLEAGGSLTNGSAKDTSATIAGEYYGVVSNGAAAIVNFGNIIDQKGFYGDGVVLGAGGSLTNGSTHDTTALISGQFGVAAFGVATVANFGTIEGGGFYFEYAGVSLHAGSLTNGSTGDMNALISGGVDASGPATITNFGTIRVGTYFMHAGVSLDAGGSVTNFGTIDGYDGVGLSAGGLVTNGSTGNSSALISGYYGVKASGGATVINFGAIDGYAVAGVDLLAGGTVTNGSARDSTALIEGYSVGVTTFGVPATITNYGTIEGSSASVDLTGTGGEVIAEAGSTFIGEIEGGYGTLALAGGVTGTISGLGAGGTLTGAVEAEFAHFNQVVIEAGGAWTLAGTNKVDQTASLVDEGTLINSGALTISGTLSIAASAVFRLASGDILPGPTGDADIVDYGLMIKSPGRGTITVGAHMFDRGVVEVASGTLDFTSRLYGAGVLKIDAGATLEADAGAVSTLTVSFDGAVATLALKTPKTFDATLSGFAAGDIIDLLAIKATGASVNGSDQLVIVNGASTVASLQLSGNYAGATFATASDGHGGTSVTLTSGGPDLPSVQRMVSAMASLAAPAGVATLGYDLRAERTPVLARPNVHLQ